VSNPAFGQIAFRFRADDGSELSASWRQAQNTNDTVTVNTNFRVRFRIDETNSVLWSGKTWQLRYSLNGAAYALVTGSTPVQIVESANFTDGTNTSSQLTGGTGTFVTNNFGMKEATGGVTNSGTAGQLFELEFNLKIDAAQVSNGNTIALRIYDGSNAIAAYTQTPTITVSKPSPTFEQKVFRLYADGTESGSSALANQDTNYTADLTSGDLNLAIRLLIQETNNGFALSTDDFELRTELNDSGTFSPITGTIDSYDFANADAAGQMYNGSTTARGQSVTGDGGKITSIKLRPSKTGSPTGNAVVKIYAHSGTFGTSSVPTGSALATSDNLNVSTLSTSAATVEIAFSGANQYQTVNSTKYVFALEYTGGDASNYILLDVDTSSPAHSGNAIAFFGGSWSADSFSDVVFQLLSAGAVQPYASANLTDAGATTNRLTGGSNSFVAGKISETGTVSDLEITSGNYTELLFSAKLVASLLANNDTLDFRVYRNGVALNTYTVTPRITVSKSGGAPSNNSAFFAFF
jgi:hypothetical protein